MKSERLVVRLTWVAGEAVLGLGMEKRLVSGLGWKKKLCWGSLGWKKGLVLDLPWAGVGPGSSV